MIGLVSGLDSIKAIVKTVVTFKRRVRNFLKADRDGLSYRSYRENYSDGHSQFIGIGSLIGVITNLQGEAISCESDRSVRHALGRFSQVLGEASLVIRISLALEAVIEFFQERRGDSSRGEEVWFNLWNKRCLS